MSVVTTNAFLTRGHAEILFAIDSKEFGRLLNEGKLDGTYRLTLGGERRYKYDLLDTRLNELCKRDGELERQEREFAS
jgi:hypothetical protein